MATKIHISGLSIDTNEAQIREAFTKYGSVNDIQIIEHKGQNSSEEALVEMMDVQEAQKAITQLHNHALNERKVRVVQAPIGMKFVSLQ